MSMFKQICILRSIMVRLIEKLFILSVTVVFLFVQTHAYGNENNKEFNITETVSSGPVLKNIFIFPQVGVQIEDRVFSGNDAGYKMEPHRIIDLDILRINKIIFSLFMNEFLIYNKNRSGNLNPESINYEMDYANVRWENYFGILSLFVDHNCTNIFNEYLARYNRIRWYGVGIRWESYGMKPGRKDIHSSGKINNLNYRLSVSKAISTKVLTYDYLITGILRYDILKYNIFVPYLEGSVTSLIDNQKRFNWGIESGLRMCFDKGDIAPFVGMNHKYDTGHYKSNALDLYFIGMRLETLLISDAGSRKVTGEQTRNTILFPDFHFRGEYGKYINDDNLNFNTDIFIGLDFLSTFEFSPFIYDTLMHNSEKLDSGMFPRYIEQNIEAGISCKLDSINALLEPFYGYIRRDDGNYNRKNPQRFSSAGLRLVSRNMKTGYANNGINFESVKNFEQINKIDWSVSAERIFNKFYYRYSWQYNIALRWNILRFNKSIGYMSAQFCFLMDREFDEIYNIETGLRIQSGMQWILFYRFEYCTAADPGNGLFKKYNIMGIRFEI
jgi:hypothetical protein